MPPRPERHAVEDRRAAREDRLVVEEATQVVRHLPRRRVPRVGVLRRSPSAGPSRGRGERGVRLPGTQRASRAAMSWSTRCGVVARERRLERQQLVERDAERVDVGAVVDGHRASRAPARGSCSGACRGCSPVIVMPAFARLRARPKSVIQRCPRASTSRFAGFTSRWTTPFSWAWSRASAACTPKPRDRAEVVRRLGRAARTEGRGLGRRGRLARVRRVAAAAASRAARAPGRVRRARRRAAPRRPGPRVRPRRSCIA